MSYLSYVCPHDCPRTCALEAGRLDKRIICRIKGAKSDSYTTRVICAKVVQYSERIRHPKRLLHPRLRAGAVGTDKFVDIGCDEALDKVPEYKKAYVSDVIRREGSFHPVPRITLSTVHGSKGGEADNVMILSDLSRKADESYWRDKDDERRVFYVALTRAKQSLYIVRSKTNREFREVFL